MTAGGTQSLYRTARQTNAAISSVIRRGKPASDLSEARPFLPKRLPNTEGRFAVPRSRRHKPRRKDRTRRFASDLPFRRPETEANSAFPLSKRQHALSRPTKAAKAAKPQGETMGARGLVPTCRGIISPGNCLAGGTCPSCLSCLFCLSWAREACPRRCPGQSSEISEQAPRLFSACREVRLQR